MGPVRLGAPNSHEWLDALCLQGLGDVDDKFAVGITSFDGTVGVTDRFNRKASWIDLGRDFAVDLLQKGGEFRVKDEELDGAAAAVYERV